MLSFSHLCLIERAKPHHKCTRRWYRADTWACSFRYWPREWPAPTIARHRTRTRSYWKPALTFRHTVSQDQNGSLRAKNLLICTSEVRIKACNCTRNWPFSICFFCRRFRKPVAVTWRNAPENQYPVSGGDYVVQCEVSANPPPTIDWLRNGDQVSIFPQPWIRMALGRSAKAKNND